MNDAPIGIFDSGLGGLTVLAEVEKALPDEELLYFGDTARVPYGTRSPETVNRYALEVAEFLVAKGVKALVVACNTASALAVDNLRAALEPPIIDVVGPGARAAIAAGATNIGVIGTRATVASGAYERAILALDGGLTVHSAACPLFVPLVEEGRLSGEIPRLVAQEYLQPLLEDGIDALLLGCTHYPLLKPLISELVGPSITVIDSAEHAARFLADELKERGLLRSGSGAGFPRFFASDAPEHFAQGAKRFLKRDVNGVQLVDLDPHRL